MTDTPLPPIRKLDAAVMEVLWDLRTATVREVAAELLRRDAKRRAYTTIMTICARLAGRGLLTRTRVRQTDVYAPALTRQAYRELRAASGAAALVEETGDLALVHFARQLEALDPERRAQLERLARGD